MKNRNLMNSLYLLLLLVAISLILSSSLSKIKGKHIKKSAGIKSYKLMIYRPIIEIRSNMMEFWVLEDKIKMEILIMILCSSTFLAKYLKIWTLNSKNGK